MKSQFNTKEVTAYIEKWKRRLNLEEWHIEWNEGNEYSNVVQAGRKGEVHIQPKARNAFISLSPFIKDWKSTIKHEMLEILLDPIADLVPEKLSAQLEIETHTVIHRLERIIRL